MKHAISLIKASGKIKENKKADPEIITIRRGNTTFCSVRRAGSSLRLDFANGSVTEALMAEIEDLIKRHAKATGD